MASNATSTPAAAVFIPTANVIIGPLFIGNLVNWFLLGTLLMQIYFYLLHFPRDPLGVKALVGFLMLLDVTQTILGTHVAWWHCVMHWDDAASLEASPWTQTTFPIMCGLTAAVVQLFYAWRIWTLASRKPGWALKLIAVMVVIVSLTQCFAAIVSTALIEITTTLAELLKLHPGYSTWLAGSFVADILITFGMVSLLSESKARTAWVDTQSKLNRLILNAIQTGAVTVVCAGVDLALFLGFDNQNYHYVPAYVLGKLYSNSLLLTLNLRSSDGFNVSTQIQSSQNRSFTRGDGNTTGIHTAGTTGTELQIRVARHTDRSYDPRGRGGDAGVVSVNGAEQAYVFPPDKPGMDDGSLQGGDLKHPYNATRDSEAFGMA